MFISHFAFGPFELLNIADCLKLLRSDQPELATSLDPYC